MQFPRGSEAEKYAARWITINPSKSEGDGRPVLIDEEGRIQGGSIPKEAHGKPIGDLGKNAKATKAPTNAAPPKPARPAKSEASPRVREWASRTFSDPSHAEAFAKWFGGSKIVNVDGEPQETHPIRLYHGTRASFDAFDQAQLGGSTKHPTARLGFFFSESETVARTFSGERLRDERAKDIRALAREQHGKEYHDITDESIRADLRRQETSQPMIAVPDGPKPDDARVITAYLSIANPYEMSLNEWNERFSKPLFTDGGRELVEKRVDDFRKQLEADGYDGIVLGASDHLKDRTTNEYSARSFIAFRPTQIKSTDNVGTFDPKDARMNYAKGSEAERYALRWITIGRKQTSDGKRGGFPVQIDDDGKIVGGKRAESLGLHGTHVSDVKEHFDERRAIQSEGKGDSVDFDFGAESATAKRKSAASELPGKRTAIREKLIDLAGDDERDQASLYERMKTIVAIKANEAREFNDQLDEFYGSRVAADKLSLIGKLRKRSDSSKVEGFDQLLDAARRHYPALLNHPEADGDEEWSLAEAIRGGKRRVPTINDDDVAEEALRGWEPPSEYVSEARDDEWDAVPFAKGSEAEKYLRRWATGPSLYAKDDERWITIGGQKQEDGKRKGGRPVLIDKDGVIVGGAVPKSTQGKPVGEFGKHVKGAKAESKGEAKPAAPKAPHEQTFAEFIADKPDGDKRESVRAAHRSMIRRALAAGKDVPSDVLKEYPDIQSDLQPKPEPPKPAEDAEPKKVRQSDVTGAMSHQQLAASPAGNLNIARHHKSIAWNAVKNLRRELREAPAVGGNKAGIRLKLMRAEEDWQRAIADEKTALAAIEAAAPEGTTTLTPKQQAKQEAEDARHLRAINSIRIEQGKAPVASFADHAEEWRKRLGKPEFGRMSDKKEAAIQAGKDAARKLSENYSRSSEAYRYAARWCL